MSFSRKIKKELSTIESNACCQKAECYGLLLFGRAFSLSEMSILTQSPEVADLYARHIKSFFNITALLTRSKADKYTVSVNDFADRKKILNEFGYTGNEIALRINYANFENDCCINAFLRGVFLSIGFITDPKKDYHLEFITPKHKLSTDLLRIIEELSITPKQIRRKSGYSLYIKDGESIEDVLGFMGASNAFLYMMNVRASKDMLNKINRQYNFETANLHRTIEANMAQLNNINTIIRLASLDILGDELFLLSRLRLDNKEATLAELGEMMEPSMSRSAVSRRFKKIEEKALELKKAANSDENIHNK
ncbi:MAG: DNA-binding protein WhiA [Clostridiales bacterium]|jgi:DNA-binding protein WhiA|nr:DNA-binding protein WhiA [Clostridiales bacterium]